MGVITPLASSVLYFEVGAFYYRMRACQAKRTDPVGVDGFPFFMLVGLEEYSAVENGVVSFSFSVFAP